MVDQCGPEPEIRIPILLKSVVIPFMVGLDARACKLIFYVMGKGLPLTQCPKRPVKNWPLRVSTFLAGGNCLKSKKNAAEELNELETSNIIISNQAGLPSLDRVCGFLYTSLSIADKCK